jgi:CDP-glycerol glycerophosphotransferase (TagB/SpsB family)
MKPVILFESYPDFSGSPLEIYNELVKRGYDKKYDLIWAVYSTFNEKTNYKVVKFHGCNSPEKQEILARTKAIIDSNRYIYKPRPDVFRLHTRHGCSFKKCIEYYSVVGQVDAILTTSEPMKGVDERVWPSHLKGKFIVTGLPALDALFSRIDLNKIGFIKHLTGSDKRYSKIIGWLPTFRKHRKIGKLCGKKFPFGLPILYTIDAFKKLNDELMKKNVLLLIQMHHAQAKDYQTLPKFSNICFVNEDDKKAFGLTTHKLMSAFDAMLTDYSAAYHEYLILNRPIGLTIDDLVEYSRDEGFCYNYLDWIKGDYIIKLDALLTFVANVTANKDPSKAKREESLRKIHSHIDNMSTKRVVDYLVSKAKL